MFERSMLEPHSKRLRMPKHGDLEAAMLVGFQQTRSLNGPISGLLVKRANNL